MKFATLAALAAFIGLPALAAAQTSPAYSQIDCMSRDGGPSGCSRGQLPTNPFGGPRGSFREAPSVVQPDQFYGYYRTRRADPRPYQRY
jgi:hypothetical protein